MRRRLLLHLLLAPAALPMACTKRKQAKDTPPPPMRPAAPSGRVRPPAIAEHDMTGRPRAKPRATMGALEAEPGARVAPPKEDGKPPRKRTD
ncbi:MAG: hypothetical protein ACLGHO_10655 [Gammaproteobacteria bacterium]